MVTTSAIVSLLEKQIPGFSYQNAEVVFGKLGVDSFGMLELRATIERALGSPLPDSIWMDIETPAQLVAHVHGVTTAQGAEPTAATLRRQYVLNMPQMALGGLSESWLCKELGDAHWAMINAGLGVSSDQLFDGTGARLYATMTRVRLEASAPMAAFAENEHVALDGRISRFGSGLFFSDIAMSGAGKTIKASVMSSFAKRGSATSNANLVKAQPSIRAACPIEELASMPDFGLGYREQRASVLRPALFEAEYKIVPYHDINGVGLLYFAAYPTISDICELAYTGGKNQWASDASTVSRDVFYFANSDAQERLVYRVHRNQQISGGVVMESSLSRVSDGVLMAYIRTQKSFTHA